MKSVTDLVVQAHQQYRPGQVVQSEPTQNNSINEDAARHVNDIFRALQGAFPAWRAAFPDDDSLRSAKATWVKALIDAGVTDFEMIARGVRKARQSESDFFPSVGKFISWCKPSAEDYGLPTPEEAYHQASMYAGRLYECKWSHPAVYEAGKRSDWFLLRNGNVREKTFHAIYNKVCSEVMAGAEFKIPEFRNDLLAFEPEASKEITEETKAAASKALAELREGLGL